MQRRGANIGLSRALVACGLLVAWLSSCSATIDDPADAPTVVGSGGSGGPTSTGGSGPGQGATTGAGGTPVIVPVAAGGSSSGMSGAGEVCQAETREGRRVPVDMYFLVDSSGSMADGVLGGTKWEVVSGALVSFLSDARNADMGVGIGYFPNGVQTSCSFGQPDCVCLLIFNICLLNTGGSCEVQDYVTPAVPLALPPAPAAVVANLASHQISGGTPTRPAVEGALGYLEQWATQHPERKALLVLATDGEPMGCDQNRPNDIATLAAAALAGPHAIKTFVIGVGRSLTTLDAIALAGGTDAAFLVDTGGDVAASFAQALDAIRGVAATCDFLIPTEGSGGKSIDPTKVNVRYSGSGGGSILLPQVDSSNPANCGDRGGWYYDDPRNPKTIKLCDTTCESVVGGRIQVEFGCDTIVDPPR
jgi:hypothetical protein